MITAREEAELVLFGSVKEALDKTGQHYYAYTLLPTVHTVTVSLHLLLVSWVDHHSILATPAKPRTRIIMVGRDHSNVSLLCQVATEFSLKAVVASG